MQKRAEEVVVLAVNSTLIDIYCPHCRRTFNIDDVCPICRECKEDAYKIYHFFFHVDSNSRAFGKNLEAIGTIMEPIMGIPAETFFKLSESEGDISRYVQRFFVRSRFLVYANASRIFSMQLLPGSCLDFLSWLGNQPGFSQISLLQFATEALSAPNIGEELPFPPLDGPTEEKQKE